MVERPQNILDCFKGTNLKQIIFPNLDTAFNFAIANCPFLESIYISNLQNISFLGEDSVKNGAFELEFYKNIIK